jgi:predicted amidohydrolase YtcJ
LDPFLIFKDQQAAQCIIYATLTSIVFWLLTSTLFAQTRSAELILINGNIRTLDRSKPLAEAVGVSNGKIIAVGTNREIKALAIEGSRVVDVKGRLVLPGFNDAHVHFAAIGNKFSSIDLKSVRSAEDMAARLAEYARFLPKGRWILGGGFDPAVAAAESEKLRNLVDAVTPHNPVFVYSADGKTALANGAALADARISKTTPDSAGGGIGRSGTGEPNGILSGSAVRLVAALVPPNHTANWTEIIETATNYAASLGVTSVQDMHSDELADVHRQLDRAGKLKTRVYDCSPMSALPKLTANGTKAAAGDAMVRTGCVKYFSEGDESELPQLRSDIAAADKAGLQVMMHAIGTRANAIVLDAFEWAAKTNGPHDRRFRIEHAQNVAEADLSRFARSGIIASMQPWLFNGTNPTVYKRHLEHGTRLAFGSDASIVEFNPLLGIFAATQGPSAISVEEAVRTYTIGSAYAEFQEKVKGTIEPGKVADLVVLDKDIFTIRLADIPKATVLLTYVDGKRVFESK